MYTGNGKEGNLGRPLTLLIVFSPGSGNNENPFVDKIRKKKNTKDAVENSVEIIL